MVYYGAQLIALGHQVPEERERERAGRERAGKGEGKRGTRGTRRKSPSLHLTHTFTNPHTLTHLPVPLAGRSEWGRREDAYRITNIGYMSPSSFFLHSWTKRMGEQRTRIALHKGSRWRQHVLSNGYSMQRNGCR